MRSIFSIVAGSSLALHAGKNLAPHRLILAKAAADENMIAILAAHLRAQTADVAHVMLRAGIRAAGEVNVHRLVEFQLLFQMLDQRQRMAFGVGLRIFAIGIARAGDDAAGNVRLPDAEAGFFQRVLERRHIGVGHVGNDEILPDRQPHFAAAVKVGQFRQPQHLLGRDLADRARGADVIQARAASAENRRRANAAVPARPSASAPDRKARGAAAAELFLHQRAVIRPAAAFPADV